MCLSIEIARPKDVIESGVFHGHEYRIIHNGRGRRCGYVKVEPGHPWWGAGYDLEVDVHGGITFAARDVPCEKEGPDSGFWVGFDCGHCFDLPDVDLIEDAWLKEFFREKNAEDLAVDAEFGVTQHSVKDTAFVRAECERLAEQAAQAT